MDKFNSIELSKKNLKELVDLRKALKKDLFDLKIQNSIKALKQTHKIKLTKKNIARVNTALHHKINK
ncbi:50S ribosomal protein L29 [Candidatus Vampirococcus lugosii]|uniref:Large ribosomal subunit protein uL29 n=1 Tax=Candidatus Vampirococcus lugosii TaxID=2789015 RepID=A0ABS5QN09_9BACT|nr:50S ribosomal protein L29 [Candidatus Vampirococcus lugosii]MBS8121864.1 Ribosomal protein L29 [Candidatus Vampirococcus lugosii]